MKNLLAILLVLTAASTARAASHQWRFNELYSNVDGSVQFVELKECCGATAETQLGGKWILAVDADNQYDFTVNLTGNTANKYLLLATQAFADLPGAPTPDFILPENFLPIGGDTLEYWLYTAAVWTYPALPTDGVQSLGRNLLTDVNSPTNFAGETGSVDGSVAVTTGTWGGLKGIWDVLTAVP